MTPARHLALGMVLTGAAGLVDVVGFIELGGYFTSFMSGNTTQGAAALTEGNLSILGLTLSLIVLFFSGSVLGTMLATSSTRWGPSLVSGFVTLSVGAAIAATVIGIPPQQAMLLLALSAGAQNAILPARGAVRLGATFVTGTLYVAGQDLALALRNRAPTWRWAQHLAIWLALFLGAALGALLYGHLGIRTLYLAFGIYALFFLGHAASGLRQGAP